MFQTNKRNYCIWVLAFSALVILGIDKGYANQPMDDPERPVFFENPLLEIAVEGTLGISDPTPSDMLRLTDLDAGDRRVLYLTGLEYATNLSQLLLRRNKISGLYPLSQLVNLVELDLSQNLISDISPLSDLTNLSRLEVNYNEISDISALSNLTSLSSLCHSGKPANSKKSLGRRFFGGGGRSDCSADLRGLTLA